MLRPVAPLRVLVVLPRNMYFGEAGATSIDLTVRDLIEHRPAGVGCTVAVAHGGECFPNHDIVRISETSTAQKARDIARHLRQHAYDVIVVQQHLPTAAAVAGQTRIPVILHTHNFQKPMPANGVMGRLRRAYRLRRYNALAGIVHVSEACHGHFREHWPDVRGLQAVVHNGLDMTAWRARETREPSIVCVSRNVPEKGVLEAAEAVRAVLQERPGWSATFILSETAATDAYAQRTLEVLLSEPRISVLLDQPHKVVKEAYEKAAIALVPSVWREPFGRTALEAHAGGCAVISSGSGGLAEVSGGHAVMLPEVTA
ncbi:MAG: glycosyltransferase family 4 protein, partial [Hyphomicrobiaceae bacterium]|nr:glycosyltransferase family 4 protein [Hyphomicrobiaceae bacterium]